jgi:hypothetical protein
MSKWKLRHYSGEERVTSNPEEILATGSGAAGVDVVFVPSSFRPLAALRPDLDRLIGEIAPAFR